MTDLIISFMKIFAVIYSARLFMMIAGAIKNRQKITFGLDGQDCMFYSFYILSLIQLFK